MSSSPMIDRFHEVAGDGTVERLATGFAFIEGPLWHPREHYLLFTDIPRSRIFRWDADGGVRLARDGTNMANGLTYDREGRLLVCEHASNRVTRLEAQDALTVLASHFEGTELNSPNDIVVSRGGAIYFTDPHYGRVAFWGVPRPEVLGFRGLYRIDPERGRLTLLVDDFEAPNGLCFSPDESRLYVNDSERGHIRAFALRPDGGIVGGAVWAVLEGEGEGAPDGMKVDSRGHVYCTGPGGIHVFAGDAVRLGVLQIPEPVANLAFGGADLRDLFITATTSLYRARAAVPGLPVF